MDGIEKITAKISADAALEVQELQTQAQAQADEVLAQAKAQAEQERTDLLERGRRSADERKQRLISAAKMETRKLTLATKQQVLGEAFDRALEELCALPEEQYVELLTNLAVKASVSGREQIIFSPRDRVRVGKQVVVAANAALVRRVSPELPSGLTDSKAGAILDKVVSGATALITGSGLLTLSQQTRPIRGGFVMSDGDIETNCTFETLVRLQREQLELEVADLLFRE